MGNTAGKGAYGVHLLRPQQLFIQPFFLGHVPLDRGKVDLSFGVYREDDR